MSFTEPDWAELWRQLVEESARHGREFTSPEKSARYLERLKGGPLRGERDPLVELVAQTLATDSTVLDIGAAGGRWSVALAKVARSVTAVEPSRQLAAALRVHAEQGGVDNIRIIESTWEECEVEPHDVVLNSHAMYGTPDLVALIESMQRVARQHCVMAMRIYSHDGAMGELARRWRGHPHDSPNFHIGYNVLLSMGICAHVRVGDRVRHWVDDSLELALVRAKRHLYLDPEDATQDQQVLDVLREHLVEREGRLHWPDETRTALLWWPVAAVSPR